MANPLTPDLLTRGLLSPGSRMPDPLTPDSFASVLAARSLPVSRETRERMMVYADMLSDWQTRMNLVGPATLPDMWRRHFLDSVQLWPLLADPATAIILDIGSGAGFPGLVLAILGAGHVHLVDSTAKKCRFLEAVVAATGVTGRVTIHNQRIEELSPVSPAFITARACAPLARLLTWAYPMATPQTRWLLLKGQDVAAELTEATKCWKFGYQEHPSISDPRGKVIELSHVMRKRHKGK
jgi:16S rRNA (guanine527-N7)-methyltransferase